MSIARIELGIPTKRINNEEIVRLVLENSRGSEVSEDVLIDEVNGFLSGSGAKHRYWRAIDCAPKDVLYETINKCLLGIKKSDIQIVIFCSATKYVAEPAHASFIAQLHGLEPKLSFDVSDGCMGWITSLQLLDGLSNSYSNGMALVVSHEFPMGENGAIYPNAFAISCQSQFSHKLAALTIGEASTATLVDLKSKSICSATREELSKGSDSCLMPFRNFNDFSDGANSLMQEEVFYAYHNEMSLAAARPSLKLLTNFLSDKQEGHLFPHSYTNSFMRFSSLLPNKIQIHNYFSTFGNLVTSTIPAALETSRAREDLDCSNAIYCWCASAGLKIAATELKLELLDK